MGRTWLNQVSTWVSLTPRHILLLVHHTKSFLPAFLSCIKGVEQWQFSSVQFTHSVMSNSSWPHEEQHARPPCPSPTPRAYSNSCPLSWWCHPAISSSLIPFSSCLQSFPPSGSFPVSHFFTSGGQNIGVSASASFQWIFRTDFL